MSWTLCLELIDWPMCFGSVLWSKLALCIASHLCVQPVMPLHCQGGSQQPWKYQQYHIRCCRIRSEGCLKTHVRNCWLRNLKNSHSQLFRTSKILRIRPVSFENELLEVGQKGIKNVLFSSKTSNEIGGSSLYLFQKISQKFYLFEKSLPFSDPLQT